MMSAQPDGNLPLCARGDELARTLQRANQEFSARVDESAAFESLSRRLAAPRFSLRFVALALPAVAALAAVMVMALPRRDSVSIVAERVSAASGARPGARALAAEYAQAARSESLPAEHPLPAENNATPALVRRGSPSQRSAPPRNAGKGAATSASTKAQSAAAEDCLSLARGGATREAETCFVERSRGSGLGAEMALYELGRLRRDVLGDAQGALAALEQHAARFPSGSLRREVEMSALGLLVQLGRSREALERSRALLEAQAGGERRAELHVFRGNVLRRNLGDLRAAEREYSQAEALAGSAAAEASYLRGLCFEALAEPAAARDAYRRYLARPSRSRAADAQRRLERLSLP